MVEAYIRLLCADCGRDWETTPDKLPHHAEAFSCPSCSHDGTVAEFMRTEHDLETLKTFE